MIIDKSHAEAIILSSSLPVPEAGCWLWLKSLDCCGYGKPMINSTRMGAHRLSYLAFKGDIPSGACVCHSCDTPSCVNPDHLFLGTAKQNAEDRCRKGRTKRLIGSSNSQAILTEVSVERIYLSSDSYGDLALRFGVSKQTIWWIKTDRRWTHVTKGLN